jgi:hypothetical protein
MLQKRKSNINMYTTFFIPSFLMGRDNCNKLNFEYKLISNYIADSVCNIAGLQLSMLFPWRSLICYVVSRVRSSEY